EPEQRERVADAPRAAESVPEDVDRREEGRGGDREPSRLQRCEHFPLRVRLQLQPVDRCELHRADGGEERGDRKEQWVRVRSPRSYAEVHRGECSEESEERDRDGVPELYVADHEDGGGAAEEEQLAEPRVSHGRGLTAGADA